MDRIPDAVQPPAWADALPRAWYRGREKVAQSQPWFDVYTLPCGGFAIYEPGHFQEVISYLFTGDDRALLWDSGMGIGDMRALTRELTGGALPITVVNSHTHFDHMGGNHLFEEVSVCDHPVSLARAANGLGVPAVAEHMSADQFSRELPSDFVTAAYEIRGARVAALREGDAIDLGGRVFRVLHTPGHSPESLMLLDRDRGILLTGDTFYPATLYSHLDSGDGMASDFAAYRRTMRRLADELGDGLTLYCSHNEPVVSGRKLIEAADAFDAVAEGGHPYKTDERGLRLYEFDGFALVADPSKIENRMPNGAGEKEK